MSKKAFYVDSEVGTLRRLMVHYPNDGIGRIIPGKFEEWLYDDTVWLERMRKEYDYYLDILNYFLVELREQETGEKVNPNEVIVRPEYYLEKILTESEHKDKSRYEKMKYSLILRVSALEGCDRKIWTILENLDAKPLANALISGVILSEDLKKIKRKKALKLFAIDDSDDLQIFPPLPNFVFTRDVGIMVKDHLLLSKTAYKVRQRETILVKFLAYGYFFVNQKENIIDIWEDTDFFLLDESDKNQKIVTIEGGDIMMISPKHLLVGCSERTSPNAVNKIVEAIFSRPQLEIDLVSVIKVPRARKQMHIDTIFTQFAKDVWILHPDFSEDVRKAREFEKPSYLNHLLYEKEREELKDEESKILQFYRKRIQKNNKPAKRYHKNHDYFLRKRDYKSHPELKYKKPRGLKHLLMQISQIDFGQKNPKVIYCGGNQPPYPKREQ